MSKDRVVHSVSSSSSAENLHKVEEDDNPFDEAFIDAITMKERRRMDSMVGGTLQRRHSLPFLMSLDEVEEDAFEEETDEGTTSGGADKSDPKRGEPPAKLESKFMRKRSSSLSGLLGSQTDDSTPMPASDMSGKVSR